MKTKLGWVIFVSFLSIVTGALCWGAAQFPTKPIEIIEGFTAGSAGDISARIITKKMTEYLGQPIVCIAKPGGAGGVAASYVAQSKPDGYTIHLNTIGMITRPLVNPSMPYRMNQFRAVGGLGFYHPILCVDIDLPIKNIKDLVTYAKNHPKIMNYAVSGKGGTYYLVFELMKLRNKVKDEDLQCISYIGDTPAILALVGKQVQVSINARTQPLEFVRAGKIRAIAVFANQRDPLLPDVPTCVEQGFPEFVQPGYYPYLVPVKTPDHIVKILESAMGKALSEKEVIEALNKADIPTEFINSKKMQEIFDSDTKKWGAVIKEVGYYETGYAEK